MYGRHKLKNEQRENKMDKNAKQYLANAFINVPLLSNIEKTSKELYALKKV